ncbi:DNA methylase N-4/N-6 domain protein [Caldithrix abyssi DSM 13497]|uniref:Methyltransferase n=2 Tax=Caldithrix abyssi DSM 13497 TaxID=880073 RepID=H1XSJ8_CALAY|nr:DNA methyltransferase [Caldithrix abyssi]EHO42546.1 DNA methylase N-4/N-6 domain protein [Caldithrix abyssi DSM 13497]
MTTKHKIIIGDSRKMAELADESIQLIVTSPPYWQLKDYGTEEQIGFNDSYEQYINNLNLVWQECSRVLAPGCKMVINIGDQFARSVYYGRYKVIPIRTEIIRFCETIGLDYMGAIIWQKKTTMNTTGGATVMGSYPFPRNGIVEIDYEFILIFKKPGNGPKVSNEIKEKSRLTKEKWKTYFSGHWYFNGERQDNHIAMFPLELPKRIIEMFSFYGETVLDPFLGSGTTSLAAMILNRNSIGYEINENFLPIIKKKLEGEEPSLFTPQIIYQKQKLKQIDWNEELKRLPYLFKDPVKFDKKIDPRQMNFGSKISINKGESTSREFFSVQKIFSPNLIELSGGIKIRLLGVKPKPEKINEALEFLNLKVGKSKIFLKFDQIKYDQNNHLLAYVYMKNKTFINAHLIKQGFADIDDEFPFSLSDKFKKLHHKS